MAKQHGKRPSTPEKTEATVDIAREVQSIFPDLQLVGRDAARKRLFLWHLMSDGKLEAAARAAGIGRTTSWVWRTTDPAFAQATERCIEMAAEVIYEALRARAVEGTRKAVYYEGEIVGYHVEHSDTAAIFLLKNWQPDRYKDRVHTTHEPSPGFAALASQWQQQINHPELPPPRELPGEVAGSSEVIDVEHTPIKDAGVAGSPSKRDVFSMLDRLQGYEPEPSDDEDEPERAFDDAGDAPNAPEEPPRPEPPGAILDPYEAYLQARQKRS
jgi:hypothetical protein